MTLASLALLALTATGTLYYILSTVALASFFSRSNPPGICREDGSLATKLSILKPVCGVDSDASANFRTFLNQDHPNYEVLFGVLDHDDPAVGLIQGMIEREPRAALHVGSNILGFNNKVRILHNLAGHSTGEILVIADADTRVTPGFLNRIAASFDNPTVAMVTCMYKGSWAKGMPDALEGLHMTCIFAPGVACANILSGLDFGLGATIALRREILDVIGGFESIVDYLADDFQLGRKTAQIGREVKLSDCVVDIALSGESLAGVLSREQRWSVTTRVSRPVGHFGLIVTFGFAFALLFAASVSFSVYGWSVLGVVATVRCVTAYYGARICLGDREFGRRMWLLPVRDLLSFAIWVLGYFRRTVNWRGRRLRLTKDGRIAGAK